MSRKTTVRKAATRETIRKTGTNTRKQNARPSKSQFEIRTWLLSIICPDESSAFKRHVFNCLVFLVALAIIALVVIAISHPTTTAKGAGMTGAGFAIGAGIKKFRKKRTPT